VTCCAKCVGLAVRLAVRLRLPRAGWLAGEPWNCRRRVEAKDRRSRALVVCYCHGHAPRPPSGRHRWTRAPAGDSKAAAAPAWRAVVMPSGAALLL